MRLRIGALISLSALALTAVTVPTASAAAGVTATFTKTGDWGTGFEAKFTVANNGASALNGWRVEFDLPSGSAITSHWDADVTRSGDHYVAVNKGWNGAVPVGGTAAFGLMGTGSGSPVNCTVNGGPCAGGGGGDTTPPSTPTGLSATGTTANSVSLTWSAASDNVGVTGYDVYRDGSVATTSTGTSATVGGLTGGTTYTFTVRARDAAGNTSGAGNPVSATTLPGGTDPGTGSRTGAPYLYLGWGNPPSPTAVMKAAGVKWFTMAFILSSGGCNPAWDGSRPLSGSADAAAIAEIRANGGDVVPSFGGWSGNKLGPNCATPELLAGAYQQVIDAYGLKAIDIDIENSDEFENEVVQDRILTALKIVKQNNPGVQTIVTFGTTTSGPNYYGGRLIERAKAIDAKIDIFTIMPFDFGSSNIQTDTIKAATGLKDKLKSTFGWSDAVAYGHVGISGMNGLSDQQELTSVAAWTAIRDWSRSNGLGRLAFWSVNRDRGCAGGGVTAACSGIDQTDWEFSRITAGF
jgi:hypothetical protein